MTQRRRRASGHRRASSLHDPAEATRPPNGPGRTHGLSSAEPSLARSASGCCQNKTRESTRQVGVVGGRGGEAPGRGHTMTEWPVL